jgi:hypothetical protein
MDLCRSLKSHDVDYAIVGGAAVALHGVVRGTLDVDVIVNLEPANLARMERAMAAIGLVSRLPLTAAVVSSQRESLVRDRNLIAWSFVRPDRPIDVVDVIIAEDLAGKNTVVRTIRGYEVRVLAIDELIAMKTLANRSQDIEDVASLKRLKGEGGRP